jgi:hypothetical protein
MKERETRTLRVEIPSDLANLLDQWKLLKRYMKRDIVGQALNSFLDSLDDFLKIDKELDS